MYKTIGMLVAE